MKLVLDTVVLVRALIQPGGKPGQLVYQWRDAFEWIVSPEITAEYLGVTSRPRLMRKFTTLRSRAIVADILSHTTSVTPASVPAVCRDPHDDMFLAAALASGANYIVSEDLDLLSLREYESIVICSSQAMIDILSAGAA
jgi:putative PIN family toxin of toxin-antitoxin system